MIYQFIIKIPIRKLQNLNSKSLWTSKEIKTSLNSGSFNNHFIGCYIMVHVEEEERMIKTLTPAS